MNKLLAALVSTAFLVVSVPAFACDGHKEAKSGSSDDTVVTATHDAACTNPDGACADETHGKKDAKKKKTKAKASEQKAAGDA